MSDKKINCCLLTGFLKKCAWILFTLIIGYLLLASIFSSCYLGKYYYPTLLGTTEINTEHTFYIRDCFLPHFVVFAVFSLLLIYIRPEKLKKLVSKRYFSIAMCIMAGIISALVVLSGQYYPKYDQMHVMEAASRLNQHIYTDFEPGEYLFVFPFQTGIVLYFQLLSLLFGNNNYIAFQLVNCLWIALAYYFFTKIASLLWEGHRFLQAGTAMLGVLFLPYLLYATFLYGTVVGMAFALFSFYMILLYEKSPRTSYLIISGMSMGIATVTKSNYVIFMIAALIYLFLKFIQNKTSGTRKVSELILIAVLILCFLLGKFGVNAYVRSLNDGKEVKGIPMTAWITMGLQDGKGAPGWYNGYNNGVYIDNDYDYDKTSAAVIEEMKRIVRGYPKNIKTIKTSISFFVKKISSQWNNPTFQSLWILEERIGKNGMDWILHGAGRYVYTLFVNLLQTWILAGVFLYAILRSDKSSLEEIILPVAFIGGFIFHIVWEAEGLYAILYFPLLLPLAICGYEEWRSFLLVKKELIAKNGWKSESGKALKKRLLLCSVAAIFICALSYTDPFAKMIARNENTDVFNVYTQDPIDETDLLP
ncbi:MAG: glycosyltransferase family 39 protein [Ruminococcus flavefaciens]|nr:glycosyltransferase family 39 protein [Ruminococcus flavefaciens]